MCGNFVSGFYHGIFLDLYICWTPIPVSGTERGYIYIVNRLILVVSQSSLSISPPDRQSLCHFILPFTLAYTPFILPSLTHMFRFRHEARWVSDRNMITKQILD